MTLKCEAKKRVFDTIKQAGIQFDKVELLIVDTACDMMADAIWRECSSRALDSIRVEDFAKAETYMNTMKVIAKW